MTIARLPNQTQPVLASDSSSQQGPAASDQHNPVQYQQHRHPQDAVQNPQPCISRGTVRLSLPGCEWLRQWLPSSCCGGWLSAGLPLLLAIQGHGWHPLQLPAVQSLTT